MNGTRFTETGARLYWWLCEYGRLPNYDEIVALRGHS